MNELLKSVSICQSYADDEMKKVQFFYSHDPSAVAVD